MVDIGEKAVTRRKAEAIGYIQFSNGLPIKQIQMNLNKKGDVISIARISGIMAVKKTSEMIVLCHPLNLTKIEIEIEMLEDENRIKVTSTIECQGKTGVEMEALTGVNIALLNIYDLCKAVDKQMKIQDVFVTSKQGGKSNFKSNLDIGCP